MVVDRHCDRIHSQHVAHHVRLAKKDLVGLEPIAKWMEPIFGVDR